MDEFPVGERSPTTPEKCERKQMGIPSPELPRGEVLTHSRNSPLLPIHTNNLFDVKNSTVRYDFDGQHIGSLSAFLHAANISPIKHRDSSATDVSSSIVTESSFASDSCGTLSDSVDPSNGQIKESSVQMPQPKLRQMSVIGEVTEPVSETCGTAEGNTVKSVIMEKSMVSNKLMSNQKDPKISLIEEAEESLLATPQNDAFDSSKLSKKLERLLWAPMHGSPFPVTKPDGLGDGDDDDFECPSEGVSPPVLNLRSLRATTDPPISPSLIPRSAMQSEQLTGTTADKGTQTCEEDFFLDVNIAPTDSDAVHLKQWIQQLFENKIPDVDS